MISGMAASDSANSSISISPSMSIRINSSESAIDFGACAPDIKNDAPYNISSNYTGTEIALKNCTGWDSLPGYIEILNDGNTDVNLTVSSSLNSSTFIGGTDAFFGFSITNGSDNGGCNSRNGGSISHPIGWIEFTDPTLKHQACYNLSYINGKYSTARLYLLLQIPPDPVPGNKSALITFTANNFV